MKQHINFLLSASLLMTCALNTFGNPIRPQQAQQIANRYALVANTQLKRVTTQRFALPATSTSATLRMANANANASLYIYSRGAGKGFVIVSGDDCLPEVLGVAEQGDWNEATLPPALISLVDYYSEVILDAQSKNAPRRTPRAATGTKNISPLIQTHWHQSWPYNNSCPYDSKRGETAVTGCVATAAAQVAYYWQKEMPEASLEATPKNSAGDAPVTTSLPKGTAYNWDLMQTTYYYGDPTANQTAVANLMFIIGTTTGLTYSANGTFGVTANLTSTFDKQFNATSMVTGQSMFSKQEDWEKKLLENLEAKKPMVYSGADKDGNGHAFVLDGYRVSDNLFHFNLGWGGEGDGYYTVDTKTTAAGGFYQTQHCVCDITPRTRKIKATITIEDSTLLKNVDTPIKVKITNTSVAAFKNLYLYCTTKTKISSTDKPADKDEETLVNPSSSKTFTFHFKPTLASQKFNIFVVDGNGTIYAQMDQVPVMNTKSLLNLSELSISATDTKKESVTLGDSTKDVNVYQVYDPTAVVTALVSNNCEGSTICQPLITCAIDTIKASALASVTTQSKDTLIKVNTQAPYNYSFTKLVKGPLYRASLTTTSKVTLHQETLGREPVIWFRLTDPSTPVVDLEESDDAGIQSIYDLSGRKTAQPLQALPNGIYIINGKKIIK